MDGFRLVVPTALGAFDLEEGVGAETVPAAIGISDPETEGPVFVEDGGIVGYDDGDGYGFLWHGVLRKAYRINWVWLWCCHCAWRL